MTEEGQAASPEEFKAMANPLRLRILRLCLHEALTNKELAERLGKDPATTLHHVRLLVKTGFLAAEPVRTGAKGALEKPYLATRKSWTLHASRPEDEPIRLKLNPASAKRVTARLERLVQQLHDLPEDADGEQYGLFIGFHKRA